MSFAGILSGTGAALLATLILWALRRLRKAVQDNIGSVKANTQAVTEIGNRLADHMAEKDGYRIRIDQRILSLEQWRDSLADPRRHH